MAEPVYESERPGTVAKVVPLILAGIFIWFCLNSGTLRGGRASVVALITLGMVWLPDLASHYFEGGPSSSMVSKVGWFGLWVLMIPPVMSWVF